MNNNEKVEREFSLYDIFWTTVEKWRMMIIFIIIAVIILVIYGYGSNKAIVAQNLEVERMIAEREAEETGKAEEEKEEKEDVIDISDLTDLEQEKVELYLALREDYELQKSYNDNSILMNLDYQNIPKVKVQFQIGWAEVDGVKQGSDNELLKTLRGKLRTVLTGQELKEAVGEVVSDEKYTPYLNECTDYGVVTNKVSEESINVFAFAVVAPTEDQVKQVAKKAIELINKEFDRVSGELGAFELRLISNEYVADMDTDLLTYQKTNTNNLISVNNNLKSVGDSLNTKERQYIYQLTDGKMDLRVAETASPESLDSQTGEEVQELVIKPTVSLVLWGAAGIVAGILLTFVVAVLVYLNNKKLRLYDVVAENVGIRSMQTVFAADYKIGNVIDTNIFKLRYRNVHFFHCQETLKLISADIKVMAVNKDINNVFISCYDMEKEKTIVEGIIKQLENSNINVNYGRSILYDAEALGQLAESQAVVFIEECDKTLYKELQKERELCTAQGVFVMGMIAQVSN